jgi:uncharacterized protein
MDRIEDKLSRVSALRPRSRVPSIQSSGVAANSEELLRMLEGEDRLNRLGKCIRVQRRFAEPNVTEMNPRALRLLAPDPTESLCDSNQWLFLDTETTGLAGGTGTYAFLVGLAWWEADGFVVEQYFMRDHSEEPSLLLEVLDRLAQRRVLVTFNGKSFDWPLLKTRYQMTRTGAVPEPVAHLDLLHPARQIWRLQLRSVALSQLERQVLQLDRGEDIPSATIPQRYFDFLRGGSPEAIAEVFRHNQMDLCGLASLALHMLHILANPENGACCAGELYGISRLLQKRGENHLAGHIYRKALDDGLPRDAELVARRELALLAKRGRDFELANALWEKLLDDAAEGFRAYEQLAIYYEHRASLPQQAIMLVREAIVRLQETFHSGRLPARKYQQWHARFQHRMDRLTVKIGRPDIGSRNPD